MESICWRIRAIAGGSGHASLRIRVRCRVELGAEPYGDRMVETPGEVLMESRKRRPVAYNIRGRGPLDLAPRAELGRFSPLLEALPAAIYTTDPVGRITSYNQAAAELWGCRP